MVFSSIIFMFTFLPIILVTYYLSPRKLKNFILLLLKIRYFYIDLIYLIVIKYLSVID